MFVSLDRVTVENHHLITSMRAEWALRQSDPVKCYQAFLVLVFCVTVFNRDVLPEVLADHDSLLSIVDPGQVGKAEEPKGFFLRVKDILGTKGLDVPSFGRARFQPPPREHIYKVLQDFMALRVFPDMLLSQLHSVLMGVRYIGAFMATSSRNQLTPFTQHANQDR